MKPIFRTKLVLAGFLACLLVFSQNPPVQELEKEYALAVAIYDEATKLGSSDDYDEEKENALNREALERFQKLIKKIPSSPFFDSLRFHIFFTIGELEHFFENYDTAIENYAKAIDIHKKLSLADSLLFRPYIYSGLIYYQRNQINTASQYFNLADSIQLHYAHPLSESERLYNTLGVIHYETGNYRLAQHYFRKALELLPLSNPYYKGLLINYKINLAHIHFTLEEYDEATRIYHELLAFNTNQNEIYLNLGIIHLNLGAATIALEHFRKVNRDNYPKLARLYNNMGRAFLQEKDMDSARQYFQLALSTRDSVPTDHAGIGLALKSMGDLLLQQDSAAGALEYYANAIPHFYPAYSSTDIKENPQRFTGVFSFASLFSTIIGKAEAAHALFLSTKDLSWAEEELEAYQSAFKLAGYVEKTYNSDEARIFINRYKYEVHGKPIDIAFELYEATKDFKYIEALYQVDQQNKASVLALNQHLARQRSEKDSALLRQEREIKASITRNLLKASQAKDTVQQAAYSKEITDQEILLDRIQKQLSQGGPVDRVPSISELQKKLLDDETAILSYHLADDKITILAISPKKLQVAQVNLPEGFHEGVKNFVQALRDPSLQPDKKKGEDLYSILFTSVNLTPIKRLVIIPDDELNFLPFESLQDENGKYLFERFSIQYQYSTAVLKKEKGSFKKHETFALAPFAMEGRKKDSIVYARLPFSGEEVEELKGEKLLGKTATRKAFLQNVGDYKVVHLATHAVAGEGAGGSFIVFSEDNASDSRYLYAEEIYNLELKNTELVILSACETGAGKLVKGEGVMSLSRAFTYAGCSNIITSLWKADDLSTSYLTRRIHAYLNEDYTIDRAMQAARMDFLKDPKIHPNYKHPYYWSHLVFIGNYEAGNSFNWWWVVGGIFVLLIVLIFLRKLMG